MATVSASIQLAAAPAQAWAVLSDPSRFSSWVENHEGWIGEPPTAFAPGGSFGQRVRVLGMPADVRWTVVGLEEPKRLVLSGNGPMGIALTATYLVDPAPAGSTVTTTFAFSGAAVPAVGGQLQRELTPSLESSLDKLKALVEG